MSSTGDIRGNQDQEPGEMLLKSAEEGNLEDVVELLDKHPNLVDYKDTDGYSSLHRACYSEKPNVARYLILKGANVGSRTLDGLTPLHSACNWNSFKCVRVLMENNVDINAQTDGGQTALHLASSHGSARESMILLLTSPFVDASIRNSNNELAFDLARRSGKLSYLFELVDNSINKIRK